MATPAFQLSAATPGTLSVSGELTFATAADALLAMRAALAGGGRSRLDLAGVTHSDSAGLACVLAVLAKAGSKLEVQHLPASLRQLAQVCEVESLLAV